MAPRYGELAFILLIGLLQPLIEIFSGPRIATYYNVIAALIVVGYVAMMIIKHERPLLRQWGLRTDTFHRSIVPYGVCTLIAAAGLYGYGSVMGHTPLPYGFWYVLALYPLWGMAQQCVLQNFLAKNLTALIPSILFRSLITGLLFACAHLPSIALFIVAFGAGVIFTWLFDRYPNLFALSIAHGILGALVFHLVLGQDQWRILMEYFA